MARQAKRERAAMSAVLRRPRRRADDIELLPIGTPRNIGSRHESKSHATMRSTKSCGYAQTPVSRRRHRQRLVICEGRNLAPAQVGFTEPPSDSQAAWSRFGNTTGNTKRSVTPEARQPPTRRRNLPSTVGRFVEIDISADSAVHSSWRQPVRVHSAGGTETGDFPFSDRRRFAKSRIADEVSSDSPSSIFVHTLI